MADRELKKVEQELDAAIRDALKDDPEGLKTYEDAEARRKAEAEKKAKKGKRK